MDPVREWDIGRTGPHFRNVDVMCDVIGSGENRSQTRRFTSRLLSLSPARRETKERIFAWGSNCSLGSGNILYLIPATNYWVTFWCFVLIVAIIVAIASSTSKEK